TRPKMLLEIAGQARDLFQLVLGRDGDENGLVEAAADEFNLATLDQFSKAVKIFGAMLLYPGEQRTGIMKTEANVGMFFQALEKHTSELQSRSDLVCRLLLEKKKYK